MPHEITFPRIALGFALLSALAACDTTSPSNPLPVISEVGPAVIIAGVNGATVTLLGEGFKGDSRAQWNGSDRPTSFDETEKSLTVQLSPEDVAAVGSGEVTVENPPPTGGRSQPATVAIRPPIQGDPFIDTHTLYIGLRPRSVATANGIFYVAQMDGRSAMKGDVSITTDGRVGRVSLSADQPVDVAMDPAGTRAYVAHQAGRSVSIIAITSRTLIDTVIGTVPLPDQAATVLVSPDGSRLYVSSVEGHVFVIDAGTKQILATVSVSRNAFGMALDAANKVLYVSSRNGPVSAVDLTSNQVKRTYDVAAGSERIVVSPDGSTLYVAGASGLEIVDLAAGTSTRVAGLPDGAMGLSLCERNQLMISFPSSGIVDLVAIPTGTVTHTLGNMGLVDDAICDPLTGKALVTDEYGRLFIMRFFF